MKTDLQILRKFVSRSAVGAVVIVAALCLGLGAARAATRTHAKSHVTRRGKTTVAHKATLRRASYRSSYKTKTTHRRRRRWRHHVILPKRPSEQRTEQIQEALGRGGYYSGNPNGKWDVSTQASLRRFQEANGLAPTGKLDALTLQKMGLGSDTAGVSAPRAATSGTPGNSSPSSDTTTVPKTPGQ